MNPEKEKWVLLLVLTLIWGSSFILIKKSLLYYHPIEVGALRVFIASLMLLPYAILNIRKIPKKHFIWIFLSGITGNFIPMFLFPMAETKISSSIAGIINSMVPIFIIVLTLLFWKKDTTKNQIIGIIISFVGVCILTLGKGESGDLKLIPILLLLLATLLYAINSLMVKKKLANLQPKLLSAYVFGFALFFPSLITLLFSGFFRDFQFSHDQLVGLGFVSMLAGFGTGFAMMLNYRLLHVSSAIFASTVTLLMPIVAVFWGLLDGEKITLMQSFGGVIIFLGLLFLRKSPKMVEKRN